MLELCVHYNICVSNIMNDPVATSFNWAFDRQSHIIIPSLIFEENQPFTIEWFQYRTDVNNYMRIFQCGFSEQTTFAFITDINGTHLILPDGSINTFLDIPDTYLIWTHIAIVRDEYGLINLYYNGVPNIVSPYYPDKIELTNLYIGNTEQLNDYTAFEGDMLYFVIYNGAKYTEAFNTPTVYPRVKREPTILFLSTFGNFGPLSESVIMNGINTGFIYPNGFDITSPYYILPVIPPPEKPNYKLPKQLYSNNALVYYKRGSLSVGADTVRNYRHKAKHT